MSPSTIIRQLASPVSFNYLAAERPTIGAEQHGWRPGKRLCRHMKSAGGRRLLLARSSRTGAFNQRPVLGAQPTKTVIISGVYPKAAVDGGRWVDEI
jgi:hypothetical protein